MPLYDYRCRCCGTVFEALVRAGIRAQCHSCNSADLEQLPSAFAVSSHEQIKASARLARKQGLGKLRDEIEYRRELERTHDNNHE